MHHRSDTRAVSDHQAKPDSASQPKRVYRSPKLICFGDLQKITQTKPGIFADTGPSNTKIERTG